MARIVILCGLLVAFAISPASAQPVTPAYVAVGDSIEFGLGDDTPGDGPGCVPLVAAFLTTFFGQPVETHNFGRPFAQTREIWRVQAPAAISAAEGNAPVVVSWGGGGNDLADVVTG